MWRCLHEKAQETRQNETRAYLILVFGTLLFVAGTLATLKVASNLEWLLLFPYDSTFQAEPVLDLSLIVGGLCLVAVGTIMGLRCSIQRSWIMREMRRACNSEVVKMEPRKDRKRKLHKSKSLR